MACVAFFCTTSSATIVERVVAVVEDKPILLSELRQRTKPFLKQLEGAQGGIARNKAQLYSEMLNRMVDEELVNRAALKAQVTVTRAEVDAAVKRVATGNGVEVEELLEQLTQSGATRADYRKELRRQLLDAKVIQLQLQGRIRISEDDLRREYEKLQKLERQSLPMRLAAIQLALPEDKVQQAKVRKLAAELRARAVSGEDFSQLVKVHSDDPNTKDSGGLLPRLTASQMPEELGVIATKLELGEYSPPIESGNSIVILKLIERDDSALPALEDSGTQLQQRVQVGKMEQARRRWLDGLRKRTHVEVRL